MLVDWVEECAPSERAAARPCTGRAPRRRAARLVTCHAARAGSARAGALAVLPGYSVSSQTSARPSPTLQWLCKTELRNAVSLNSVLAQRFARAVGPAVAGLIIAFGGLGICFLLYAVSFAAVVYLVG